MSLHHHSPVYRACHRLGVLAAAGIVSVVVPANRSAAQAASARSPASDTTLSVHIDSLLDLQTVVQRALNVSPAVVQGEEAIRTARSAERVSVGAYVPSVSANSSVMRSNVTTPVGGIQAPDSRSAGLAASVDLFTGGRRGAERSRTHAELGAAEATNVSQRFSATLVAQRAFYETLRAAQLVDVARARITQGERGYRFAQDRVRAGTTTRSDELRARLELTTGRQQLVAALDTLQTAAYVLGRLVGANGPVGAKPLATLEPRSLALTDSEVVRLAVDASPSVRTARAAEQADIAATKSARTLYVPDIRVTGGYNWANQTPIVGAIRPGWALALGTSFPLFNGWQREDAVTRAQAATEVARVTALDVTRDARAESARLLSGLRFAERNIALAIEAEQSAQEDLRVQTERYRAGISTELDQLTSQLAVTQTQLALVAARFNYQVTRAQLEALIGREL
ncbi:MAG: outer rane efflux protein [Gemmatimonadetes bacterium]|nr:outer rane efflux protein [Gemmatimonadota bacterium]